MCCCVKYIFKHIINNNNSIMCIEQYISHIYIYIYIQIANVYNSHDNNLNAKQCWSIRNVFKFILNIQIEIFVLLREGDNLFHLVDNAELNIFISYLMQWAIGLCSLMEFVLC